MELARPATRIAASCQLPVASGVALNAPQCWPLLALYSILPLPCFLHIFKRLNSCVDRLISKQAAATATTADEGEESQFEIRTRTQSQVQRGLINALCRATRKLTLHALTLDKRPSEQLSSGEQPQCGGQVSLIALRIDLNRCTLHILCIFMAQG